VFTLANPMTYGDVTTPTSPPTQSSSLGSTHTVSNPATPTNSSHSTGFSRTFERLSLKSRNKNQSSSFFKFFGRSHEKTNGAGPDKNVGVAGKRASATNDEEYGGGSSGSDHDDPFSVSVCLCVCVGVSLFNWMCSADHVENCHGDDLLKAFVSIGV